MTDEKIIHRFIPAHAGNTMKVAWACGDASITFRSDEGAVADVYASQRGETNCLDGSGTWLPKPRQAFQRKLIN